MAVAGANFGKNNLRVTAAGRDEDRIARRTRSFNLAWTLRRPRLDKVHNKERPQQRSPVRLSPPERALYTPPRSLLLGRWSARLRNEQWSGLIKKLLRQHP